MKIFMLTDEIQKKEIQSIPFADSASVTFGSSIPTAEEVKTFDAFFILSEIPETDFEIFGGKPVYINKVIETLAEMQLPKNVSRINGWPGFLERPLWEIVSVSQKPTEEIFQQLNRKFVLVKDEPGFVSARVISMIINEAFFAFDEKISSIEEIDMAMKLGTNYPNGPFEWADKIGVENVYLLLQRLAEKEERYLPAPALKNLYLEILERIAP